MNLFGYTIMRTSKFLLMCENLAVLITDKLRNKDRFSMKFNVTIQNALPIQNGTSKAGKPWSKQSYVGVYDNSNEQYPKSIVFDVLGDNIGKFNLQPGEQYELEVDFSAREWQGRYFLSATCRKASALQAPAAPQSATPTLDAMGVKGYQQPQSQPLPQDNDGLPF